eukprot:m.25321 g.25321  ORF g.25321 m.25321 type:complete len:71 (+) comp7695_c0_seq2:129-341(+)
MLYVCNLSVTCLSLVCCLLSAPNDNNLNKCFKIVSCGPCKHGPWTFGAQNLEFLNFCLKLHTRGTWIRLT